MLYCNVIHKIGNVSSEGFTLESLKFQQDAAHNLGIKTTLLISYGALFDERYTKYFSEQSENFGDEIGINMQFLSEKKYLSLSKTREPQLHLLPFGEQKKIVEEHFERFKAVFGFYPKSAAFYYLSSPILVWMKEKYPDFKTAIMNCFEEGIHMYDGNRHGWNLFCEGSPWGAYYPSRKNSMCPAYDKEDAIGIVALPHLNRDMLMAHIGRDDCFSSHSANVQRGMVNDGKKCKYLYDFFSEWEKQSNYNKAVYYNTLVSSSWLEEGKNFEETAEDSRDLYIQTLKIYKDSEEGGRTKICTMSEYADIHNKLCGYDTADVNLWNDLLMGSKRQMFWLSRSDYRLTVDPNLGGAIVDLRPYAGRIEVVPGPSGGAMWTGSYPYALHYWHRDSYHTCFINGENLFEHRTTASAEVKENGDTYLTLEPTELESDGFSFEVQSRFVIKKDGRISIIRKIISPSDADKEYNIKEQFRGTKGTGVLPEDYKGTRLYTDNGGDELSLTANYEDRAITSDKASLVGCTVSGLNTSFELSSDDKNTVFTAEEGYMFHPYYTLTCEHKAVKAGEEVVTWLTVK